jgi:hypothetical protein
VLPGFLIPGWRLAHTAWMPRSCCSDDMTAAFMQYGPVPEWPV